MKDHKPVHAPIPGLGMRSLKTAFAVALTAVLYLFLPGRNPTFACIGAMFGLGADKENSRLSGGNRFFGTIIGGVLGMLLYAAEHFIAPQGSYLLRLPLAFIGTILLIMACVLCRWPGGVQPGGVVLCIILFNTPPNHMSYAFARMLDTGIGVAVALLVNDLFSRTRLERWMRCIRAGRETQDTECRK